jgi:peptidyl-prolyl cis-trans isomerase B (cyclophilin B)
MAGHTCVVDAQSVPTPEFSTAELRERIWNFEEGSSTEEELQGVQEALQYKDTEIRRLAVRALGRSNNWSFSRILLTSLQDPTPTVRAEAAHALAELGGIQPTEVDGLATQLAEQLGRETHPLTRGILALSLGRLPYSTSSPDATPHRRAERAIVAAVQTSDLAADDTRTAREIPRERTRFAPPLTLLGALRGLESLARHPGRLEPPTVSLLEELTVVWRSAVARAEGGPTAEAAARLRRLALAALVSARAVTDATISTAFGDPDDQVRRLAAQAVAQSEPLDTKLVERAVRDQSAMVRAEILLSLERRAKSAACPYAVLLLRDREPRAALTALDVAGGTCQGVPAATGPVAALARLPPPPLPDVGAPSPSERRTEGFGLHVRAPRGADWQRAAHALVALAQIAPEQALDRLEAFATDDRWMVRRYAARAATHLKSATWLERLAGDGHDGVRAAALPGLRQVRGHAADDVFLASLSRDDDRLLLAAAEALEGTTHGAEAAPALLTALERVTRLRPGARATRAALLERISEVGSPELANRLEPFLRDVDPAIARGAAAALARWTGQSVQPDPRPSARTTRPSASDLDVLTASRVAVTVRDVGRFEVKLLAQDAPLSAWEFLRGVRAGAYDGTVLSEVVPNLLVEGDPGAGAGEGRLRSEVGLLSNVRGAVGLSLHGTTAGHFYVNLVDNPHLDFTRTIFGQVEQGAEVLDALLEGDVIDEMNVLRR